MDCRTHAGKIRIISARGLEFKHATARAQPMIYISIAKIFSGHMWHELATPPCASKTVATSCHMTFWRVGLSLKPDNSIQKTEVIIT